jgi:hypothetical protein
MFLIGNILIQQSFSFSSAITILALIAFVIIIMVVRTNEQKKENWAKRFWYQLI